MEASSLPAAPLLPPPAPQSGADYDAGRVEWYDQMAGLAAQLAQSPGALILLRTEDRMAVVSEVGFDLGAQVSRSQLFTHAAQAEEPLVVADAAAHPLFGSDALVLEEPHLRFFASFPLCTPSGERLGMLCVTGATPRKLSKVHQSVLAALAQMLVEEVDLAWRWSEWRQAHVQAAQRLQGQHEQGGAFRALAGHLPHAVIQFGTDLRVEYANPVAERLTGIRWPQLLGQHARQLSLEGASPAGLELRLEEALTTGKAKTGPLAYEATSGRRELEEVIVPALGPAGAPGSVIWAAHERPQSAALAELERVKEEAAAGVASRERFLVNMSHELRTPLSSVIGFTELMKQEATGDLLGYAELIDVGARRLMETLRSVLELAQVRSGALLLSPEPTDVGAMVHLIAARVRPLAALKRLTVDVAVPDQPLTCALDRAALDKVLLQLAENAVKFTHKGRVQLSATFKQGLITLEVSDTGTGIAPELMPHLFDGFIEGTGLGHSRPGIGLALAKGLVDLMGGTLTIQPAPRAGTRATVTLPGVLAGPVAPSAAPAAPPLRGQPRVLVVEDYAPTRQLVSAYLKASATVHCVNGPAGALAVAAGRAHFDLVLLDINLGEGESGEELLPRLRAGAACAQARFVAMTAYALPGDQDRFLRMGFDGYLAKPFTRAELTRALEVSVSS